MYIFQCIARVTVLFHVLGMISNVLSASKRQKEQAFSDVLKNITLANRILQDLLKKYERIERIHQSEELLQSNSLSSENSGQNFKSILTNTKQKLKQNDKSYKKHTNSPFKGTVMIYASESVENLPEDTKEDIEEVNTHRKPVKSHRDDVKYKKEVKKVLNKNFLDSTELKEKIKKKGFKANTSTNKNKAQFNESSSEDIQSNEVEQIIIEIPKDISDTDDEVRDGSDNLVTNIPHERKIKSYSNKPIENILGEKTRFSIKHAAPNKKGKADNSKDTLRIKNNARRIKKVYSEKFSPDKMWHEIINKPVSLQKDQEEIFRKSKRNNKKITVLILTDNKKENDYYKVKPKLPKSNANLSKLHLLSEVLRSEYGETCLQMPIRKCKKALKIVTKNICKRRFKCKSDFKSDFMQNSKDGCNKEFAFREETANKSISNNKTKINKKFSPPEFRQLQKRSFMNKMKQRNIKKLQLNNFMSLYNKTLKDAVLRFRKRRDKYEKKCQKESTKKCNKACEYAIKETCSVHTCEKRKKKYLKGECKNQCKKAYTDVKKSVKSSSKSDSDSDSESESDSGSD